MMNRIAWLLAGAALTAMPLGAAQAKGHPQAASKAAATPASRASSGEP